jgi:hypothetical protein
VFVVSLIGYGTTRQKQTRVIVFFGGLAGIVVIDFMVIGD